MMKKLQYFLLAIGFFVGLFALLIEWEFIPSLPSYFSGPPENKEHREDKSFVFIIPAYNCSDICERTLNSIFWQSYSNFRIIYIDDGSTDHTFSLVEHTITDSTLREKLTLKRFKKHKGSIERLYEAVQECKNDEIVIHLEGNSWLVSPDTLKKLNELYKTKDVWLAYAKHADYRTKKKARCARVTSEGFFSHSMRRKYWRNCQFKSFYAGLFKKVKLENFFFRGKFICRKCDRAFMFPMMEMAGNHVGFINEVLCYNLKNELLDQERPCNRSPFTCYQRTTISPPYPLLTTHPSTPQIYEEKKSDLVIFSFDRPIQLYSLLESMEQYVKGLNQIHVIYRASYDPYRQAYEDVQEKFPHVKFISQSTKPHEDFKPLLMKCLFEESSSDYILFSVDDMMFKDYANVTEAITQMEKTGAYFFSLRLGDHVDYCYMGEFHQEIPYYLNLSPTIFGWQIDAARGDWTYPNSVDLTLYRKEDVKKVLEHISFRHPNELEIAWCKYTKPFSRISLQRRVGLTYRTSKALNLPLNIVNNSENRNMNLFSPEELLSKYEKGYKIDISPLYQIQNRSVHMEYIPRFIPRESHEE